METKNKKVCKACGAKDSKENVLAFTIDLYSYEVHGDDTENWYCEQCLYDSACGL